MIRVLFVCTGNICRSSTAEGVMRSLIAEAGLAERIEVDSAGTHGYHVGEPPDRRSQAAARARGHDLSDQRARRLRPDDFREFDLLVALDRGHQALLERQAPPDGTARIALMMEFADGAETGADVPDPYYGGHADFELALDLIEAASRGLLDHLRRDHVER